jgi:hypothetical protein
LALQEASVVWAMLAIHGTSNKRLSSRPFKNRAIDAFKLVYVRLDDTWITAKICGDVGESSCQTAVF